jgi:hypothetical protein
MAVIRLYMTMSLDGYVAGPQDGVDAPMGIDGFRLFNWLDRRNDAGPSGQVFAEVPPAAHWPPRCLVRSNPVDAAARPRRGGRHGTGRRPRDTMRRWWRADLRVLGVLEGGADGFRLIEHALPLS